MLKSPEPANLALGSFSWCIASFLKMNNQNISFSHLLVSTSWTGRSHKPHQATKQECKMSHVVDWFTLIHNLPTNKVFKRCQLEISSLCCLRCHNEMEDRDHAMQCAHTDDWFQESVKKWKHFMEEKQSDPTLTSILCHQGDTEWQNLLHLNQNDHLEKCHLLVTTQQQTISWPQMWNGKTATRWAMDLLLSVWQSWDDLWDKCNSIINGNSSETRKERRVHDQRHLCIPSDHINTS